MDGPMAGRVRQFMDKDAAFRTARRSGKFYDRLLTGRRSAIDAGALDHDAMPETNPQHGVT